jgi:uncharacterized protein
MLTRAEYPSGVPCWIVLAQDDPAAAAAFYEATLGWTFEPRAGGSYLLARLHGLAVAAIASPPAAPPGPPAWHTYVSVESADAAVTDVTAAAGTVLMEPCDLTGDDARVAHVTDPSGAPFGLWEPRGRHGAELVNEPGTWNWSSLSTPDPETARSFYEALFGWEASPFVGGGEQTAMFRRPGYAEFLESIDPGIRARHAAFGAPEGFTESIGWLSAAPEAAAAEWSVTFAVADVGETCGAVPAQSGEVLEQPVRIGPVTRAVVRDPSGAAFSVNSFSPS